MVNDLFEKIAFIFARSCWRRHMDWPWHPGSWRASFPRDTQVACRIATENEGILKKMRRILGKQLNKYAKLAESAVILRLSSGLHQNDMPNENFSSENRNLPVPLILNAKKGKSNDQNTPCSFRPRAGRLKRVGPDTIARGRELFSEPETCRD
ncbi:MAG: hypothetical protein IBX58_14660 [Roseovarius sp.]|nr:hypothetical protein [Roseovarius sp.]